MKGYYAVIIEAKNKDDYELMGVALEKAVSKIKKERKIKVMYWFSKDPKLIQNFVGMYRKKPILKNPNKEKE